MKRVVILGGGISGLATAYYIGKFAAGAGIKIDIFESEDKAGGKMQTEHSEGFIYELGPNGFLDSKPSTLELCRELGIYGNLLRSNDNARKRYIFSGGKLNLLPSSPLNFFFSDFISINGKLRILKEPFIKKGDGNKDESLSDFARRRLGDEALEKLLDPMSSGIFAGNPDTMSLKSCFPRIFELEQEYGSLTKAMISLAREKKKRGEDEFTAGPSGPGGVLTSFKEGVSFLIETIARKCADSLILNCTGLSLNYNGNFSLHLSEIGTEFDINADAVVISTPAYSASEILKSLDSELAGTLSSILYSPVGVIALGYKKVEIKKELDGFGFLIPREECRETLGTLWDSSIFPNRAPEGMVLLRTMAGGARKPELLDIDDEHILNVAKKELSDIVGIRAEPVFTRICRHYKGIPQYTVGHEMKLLKINERLSKFPGLFLNSNAYNGIGLNDCTLNARLTAGKVVKFLS